MMGFAFVSFGFGGCVILVSKVYMLVRECCGKVPFLTQATSKDSLEVSLFDILKMHILNAKKGISCRFPFYCVFAYSRNAKGCKDKLTKCISCTADVRKWYIRSTEYKSPGSATNTSRSQS